MSTLPPAFISIETAHSNLEDIGIIGIKEDGVSSVCRHMSDEWKREGKGKEKLL